jgi:HEAT repeat protein
MTAEELADVLATRPADRAPGRAFASLGADAIDVIEARRKQRWKPSPSVATLLRMMHQPEVVPRLGALTRHPDLDLSAFAIDALGHGRHATALPILLELLAGRDHLIDVAPALGELGMSAAVPPLLEEYRRSDLRPYDRASVAGALARLGVGGLDADLERLLLDDNHASDPAVWGLAWSSTPHAIRALRRGTMADIEGRGQAMLAIGALGLPAGAPVVLDAAERWPDLVNEAAVILAATFGFEVPEVDDDPAPLRRWWEANKRRWRPDVPLWRGGFGLADMIDLLPTRYAREPRRRILLGAGIDLVDATWPNQGDDGDLPRARAWLAEVDDHWHIRSLYRRGVKLDVGPIVEALTAELPGSG